jgi:hypothetical protein
MLGRRVRFGGFPRILCALFLFFGLSHATPPSAEDSLRAGLLDLENGKLEASLPELIPNLSRLNPEAFTQLEAALKNSPHVSTTLLVLRKDAARRSQFSPAAKDASALAFRSAQFGLCSDMLTPYLRELDSASAHRFLLCSFYAGRKLDVGAIRFVAARSNSVDVRALAALDLAQAGNFGEAHGFLTGRTPAAVRGFIQAQELDAADKTDESMDDFREALDSKWPEFRVLVMAELFKHFSLTGNRYKTEQLWDDIKADEEIDSLPGLKEFLAYQLGLRGYEKQARYLYRSLYPSLPVHPEVLEALWEELVAEDSEGLRAQIQALWAVDSLDCDANLLAMRYAKMRGQSQGVVRYGRNVVLYCPDVVEPYLDLAMALLEVSRPAEARFYFGKYVEQGGDRNNVPTYMR